jgi:hypothetical protein
MKDTKGKKGAPTVVKSIVKDKTRKIEEKYAALLFVSACASISCNPECQSFVLKCFSLFSS